jgi:parvulin-like peptidyl-prolyl isomerase
VHETEDSPQILNNLDNSALLLLHRHGLLRSVISAEVKELLVNDEDLDPDVMNAALKSYRKRNNLNTSDQVKKHLDRHNWSHEDLQWHASLVEKIRRFSWKRFESKAENHYLSRKEQFDQVSYSQLTVTNRYLAQEFFLRLKENESTFAELGASLRQAGQEKGQGRIGPIQMSNVPAALAKPLRSSTAGTLLEPVQIQNNWLIVRLEKFQPTQFDEPMKQQMCTELFQLEVERLVNDRMSSLTSAFASTLTPLKK